jgi:hypothetical protein
MTAFARHFDSTPTNSFQAPQNPGVEKVVVCDYYTFLANGGSIDRVQSAKPATLDLIRDLGAEPIPGSLREVEPHQVSDLGFFRGDDAGQRATN